MEIKEKCRLASYDNKYTEFIIKYDADLEKIERVFETDCIQSIDCFFSVIHSTISTLNVDSSRRFGYATYPKCYGLLDTSVLEATGVQRIQNLPNLALRGSGVLIGLLDTGVNYTNSLLQNADGSTKIFRIWDQTIDSTNYPEVAYYGTEYNEDQINQALRSENPLSLVPSIDENGHGTYIASIIVGNTDEENDFQGIVPDANLIVVKLKPAKQIVRDFYLIGQEAVCFQENDIMFGIKYLTDIAQRLRKPMAICFTLGTNQGSHDGRDNLSRYLSYIGRKTGIVINIAAGNEGNKNHHHYGILNSTTAFNTVELLVGPNDPGFSMELWGRTPATYSVSITSPSGEFIPRIPARLGESREIQFLFDKTFILINYELTESDTGDPIILFRFQTPSEGLWRINVYALGDLILPFHIWLPMEAFINNNTFFLNANPDTTITNPGNTFDVSTITAYDHRTQSLFLDSSRGFTRLNLPKPDVAAPGVNIYGPTSETTFGTRSGTSISAAVATGVAAMLLEWSIVRGANANIDSIEIKSLFIRGASRVATQTYPNPNWGYGILDLYNIYLSLR